MKTIIKIKVMMVLLLFGITTLGYSASITPGYYKGKLLNNEDIEVFVKEIKVKIGEKEYSDFYGLVIREGYEYGRGALYKIEIVDDGVQAWMQINQMVSGIMTTDDALRVIYTSDFVSLDNDGGVLITLNPTDFAEKEAKCDQQIQAEKTTGLAWVEFPADGRDFYFTGDEDSEIIINLTSNLLTGNFYLSHKMYRGSYHLSEFIPGVSLIRDKEVDLTSQSGRTLSSNIEAIGVVFKKSGGMLFSDSYKFRFIRINQKALGCFYGSFELEEE